MCVCAKIRVCVSKLIAFFFAIHTHSGNHGNTIDGHIIQDTPDGMDKEIMDDRFVQSLTPPCKAVSTDRQYYHLPYEENKPCLHIKLQWQDHRRRLYLSNMLYKLLETLVCNIYIVEEFIER